MNVELFVHGVPNGESFWGKEEDRNYFGNFYSNSSDEVKFLVQTRSLNGKTYCCYNYLVYKNVIANDGRAGSYFGISLRLDAYCKDILNMYRILDTVYNVHVVGTLLKAEKANLKYVVSDFSSNPGIMEDIWNAISRLLQKAFTADSFVDLAAFPTNSGSCSAYNLYDCSGDQLMEIMKKTGIVAVSPYYPSSRVAAIEQQCNARIQAMQQQYNALQQANSEARAKERDEQKTSLTTLRDRSAKLEKEISEKDEQIRSRDAEISRLKANANRAEQIGKIEQIVGSIRKPIEELSTAFRALQPEGKKLGVKTPGKPEKQTPVVWWRILPLLLPFLNFVLLLVVLLALPGSPEQPKVYDVRESFYKQQITYLNDAIRTLKDKVSDLESFTAKDDDYKSVYDSLFVGGSELKMKIEGHRESEPLKMGVSYLVSIEGGSILDSGDWDLEGGAVLKEDDGYIIIIPDEERVELRYTEGSRACRKVFTAQMPSDIDTREDLEDDIKELKEFFKTFR